MSRTLPALVVVAVVLAAVGAPLAAATTVDSASDDEDAVPAGSRLAGVVGSQGATLSGDVRERSLDVALESANGTNATAAVVATHYRSLSDRQESLADRRDSLRERLENGTISAGEYRARVTTLAAQAESLERLANRTADAARPLPEPALRAHGVEPAALDRLVAAAGNLSGPEIAAIARNLTAGGPPADLPAATGASAANETDAPGPAARDGGDTPERDGSRDDGAAPVTTADDTTNGTATAVDREGNGPA